MKSDTVDLKLLVSLRHAEPVLRCHTIAEGAITELPVVIGDGDDDLGDEGGSVAVAAVMPLPRGPRGI